MSEEKEQELKEAIEKINSIVDEDEDARALIIIGLTETTITNVRTKDAESIILTLSKAACQNKKLMALMIAAITVAEDYELRQKNRKKNQ